MGRIIYKCERVTALLGTDEKEGKKREGVSPHSWWSSGETCTVGKAGISEAELQGAESSSVLQLDRGSELPELLREASLRSSESQAFSE